MKAETFKRIFFVDKGDRPEELLIRMEGEEQELFDVCSFACDETGKATVIAEQIVKLLNDNNKIN